jgi:hypothetical protein
MCYLDICTWICPISPTKVPSLVPSDSIFNTNARSGMVPIAYDQKLNFLDSVMVQRASSLV